MDARPTRRSRPSGVAGKHHADVLLVGHSLEGALAATLLAKRGWHVLWVGTPPAPAVQHGKDHLPAAPGLLPALVHAKAFAHALDAVGLRTEVERALRPVQLQLLEERRRVRLPEDAGAPKDAESFARLTQLAEEVDALADRPLSLGFFARRSFVRARAQALSHLGAPDGLAQALVQHLDAILAPSPRSTPSSLQLAAAPHLLPGGQLALLALLHRRFTEVGGRTLALPADTALASARLSWTGVQVTLATGDEVGARLMLLGFDDEENERLLPLGDNPFVRLQERLVPKARQPLARLSLIVASRGLPQPLGPLSLVGGEQRLLLERTPLGAGREALTAYWRAHPPALEREAERAWAQVQAVLPFVERHVEARLAPALVSGHDWVDADRELRPARRLLVARGPALGLSGLDGAGLLAQALAERARRLAPRQDLLK